MLPGPTNVPDRVMRAMLNPIINHRSAAFTELMRRVLENAKQIFQTKGDMVVFTASSSGAVEASVANIVRKGDKVVVTDFGEFGSRVSEQVEASGGHVIKLQAPLGDAPRIDQARAVFEENKDIKAVYVVHNETSTGVAFKWMQELSRLAKSNGCFLVVDAVSSLGGDELPVDKWDVDVCVTGSQKCLAAPPGLALISVNEEAKNYIVKNPIGHHYFNLKRYFGYAERGETPFTPAIPLYYALDEALSIILEEGIEKRIQRHRTCAEAFYTGLDALSLKPAAKSDVRSSTVLGLRYPEGVDDGKFRKTLDEAYNIIVAGGFGELRGKVFRVGCMGEVNSQYVLTTIASIGAVLSSMKVEVDLDSAMSGALSVLKGLQ